MGVPLAYTSFPQSVFFVLKPNHQKGKRKILSCYEKVDFARLFSHLDITPSKYETVNSTSFLAQTCAGHLGSCITC